MAMAALCGGCQPGPTYRIGVTVNRDTPLLTVEEASRTFKMGEVQVRALVDANLVLSEGEFVVVLGPSGSGKTTLLNLLGGTDRPTAGHVWFDGCDLAALTDAGLTDYRRTTVGFIFQFYNLVSTLTAEENVQVAADRVDAPLPPGEALQLVGLVDRSSHFPAQMSGGEQQRVAIARALAKKPRLLLADEPTGALDVEMARNVLGVLQRLNREQHLTVVLITHNPAIAEIADRVIRMVSGRIEAIYVNDQPLDAEKVSW